MFTNPHANIAEFGLHPGMTVADVGSGSGFYTLAAAKIVGDSGKVYAIDIQKDLLAKLKDEANSKQLFNVEIMWGDAEKPNGTRLADGVVQAAILSNILFQVKSENREIFIKEVCRILKPSGKTLLLDWTDSFGGLGPQKDHVVKKEEAEALFLKNGFSKEREIKAGDHHYGIIFKKV